MFWVKFNFVYYVFDCPDSPLLAVKVMFISTYSWKISSAIAIALSPAVE